MSKMSKMSNIDDGGPAFPVLKGDLSGFECTSGLSIRDYFAGQIISGIMSQGVWAGVCLDSFNNKETKHAHSLAQFSYQIADAMIAARKAK